MMGDMSADWAFILGILVGGLSMLVGVLIGFLRG
jgi:hypothetical protein